MLSAVSRVTLKAYETSSSWKREEQKEKGKGKGKRPFRDPVMPQCRLARLSLQTTQTTVGLMDVGSTRKTLMRESRRQLAL